MQLLRKRERRIFHARADMTCTAFGIGLGGGKRERSNLWEQEASTPFHEEYSRFLLRQRH
jgi:hypothetical protein